MSYRPARDAGDWWCVWGRGEDQKQFRSLGMGLLNLIVETGVFNTYEFLAFSGFSWLVLLLLLGSSFSLLHTQC